MIAFTEYPAAFTKPVYGEEMHGDEAKPLVSIYIEATVNADVLESIKPGLRDALFKRPAVNDSERLVDGQAVALIRRFTTLEPARLTDDWPGYTMTVHGDLVDAPRTWADVELGKLSIDAQDGGTAKLKVRAQMRGEGLEFWVGMMNRSVSITLEPPKAEPLPDGHPDAQADVEDDDPFSGSDLARGALPEGKFGAYLEGKSEGVTAESPKSKRGRKANGAEARAD